MFAYMLCAVPLALIAGQGCLRESESNKSGLVKSLGIVDISLPHVGSPSDLVASK